MKSLKEQTYYEVLEVDSSASMQEIRASFERLNRLLVEDNVALYPLVDTSQLAAHRAMILEAVEFLTEPDLRLEYDRSIGLPPKGWTVEDTPASTETAPGSDTAEAPPYAKLEIAEPPDDVTSTGEEVTEQTESAPTQLVMQELVARAEAVHSTLPNLTVSWLPHVPEPLPATLAATMIHAAASTPVPVSDTSKESSSTRTGEPATPAPAARAPDIPATPVASPEPPPASEVPPPSAPATTEQAPIQELATPHAPAPPPALVSAPEQPPVPEPPAPRTPASPAPARALDQAHQLAQESAIATAESALAQVSMQVGSRAPREVRPRPLDIPPDAEFNGELLRQVRKSRGLSLAQVADRTRITLRHLENVEADRYDSLPPTVYLRGILMSLARELGLDSLRVSKSYLSLVDSQRSGTK